MITFSLIFGFEKQSYSLNKASQDDISELKILKYLPKENKTFFISNTPISEITNNIRKSYDIKDKEELILIKNSLLAYLGIDLGKNQLEDIYNNELTISTYDNKEKDIDDVLIIFKINEKKDIDDVLNLTTKIDEPNKLIKIFRENKLNYLKYIYRTNDNYILTSSNKTLILDALQSIDIRKKSGIKNIYFKDLLNNLKNESNILLTKNSETNELLNNVNYSPTKDNYLITLFDLKENKIILKSYLIDNKKSIDINSYEEIDKESIIDKKNYQISIYNNLLNSYNYLESIQMNSFERAILKELNYKLKQDIIFLVNNNNWVIIFEKGNLSIEDIKLLEDFNKNSLENKNNIYTIYSKDILKKEVNIIKESFYKKIYSVQSDKLIFLSNSLLNDTDIDLISKGFFTFKVDRYGKYFLNTKINLKDPYDIQLKNVPYLENINYFFKNVINLSIIEFKAIIKQYIPETTPLFYTETNFKIL
tara:strand:- start:141 stop:1574 length:1434 start_codon:yes stop_codon:yes gene_type:complete